jgi:hypothetical protein
MTGELVTPVMLRDLLRQLEVLQELGGVLHPGPRDGGGVDPATRWEMSDQAMARIARRFGR